MLFTGLLQLLELTRPDLFTNNSLYDLVLRGSASKRTCYARANNRREKPNRMSLKRQRKHVKR
tara:strand:+ start:401 stop:589 length:189 start_codon:yes stop_codon:yes gene_type:complete